MNPLDDTIAACASGAGYAGICLIRLSGSLAFQITEKIFSRPRKRTFAGQRPFSLAYGHIVWEGETVDEVLVSKMPAPATYTRQDIVEINCHGGFACAKTILDIACSLGARAAEPGEFTKRAFLNGRIDLAQAEAVSDVILAKTDLALKVAGRQLSGKLSEAINSLKDDIVRLLARMEVTIEYPEYDMPSLDEGEIASILSKMADTLNAFRESYRQGEVLREGYRVVLTGRPNAGKSMLINTLTGADRAIVTDIPGTTRDVLEAWVSFDGIPVRLFDTAGIRDPKDEIEAIGVGRSVQAMQDADLVLFVTDACESPTDEDRQIAAKLKGQNALTIGVLNKIDLGVRPETEAFLSDFRHLGVSALTGEGIGELIGAIAATAAQDDSLPEAIVVNSRHAAALAEAQAAVESAREALESGLPIDLLEMDMKDCLMALGKITGETADEAIIDEIFAKFCVGK